MFLHATVNMNVTRLQSRAINRQDYRVRVIVRSTIRLQEDVIRVLVQGGRQARQVTVLVEDYPVVDRLSSGRVAARVTNAIRSIREYLSNNVQHAMMATESVASTRSTLVLYRHTRDVPEDSST